MKRLPALAVIVGIFCFIFLASGTLSYAQPDHQKGRSDEHKKGNPHAESQHRDYPEPRSGKQARQWQQQHQWRHDAWQGNNSWRGQKAQHWENQHRTWTQRGGYGGYYIPRDRFERSFGPQHVFRIRRRPVIVAGYPRFQYGGYTFLMADPWPESWGDNWYNTDDVYVDYGGDGYYLYDRREPGIRIALSIVF